MAIPKTIARVKWHMKELSKTFSHQPSFYSSKRIERSILFINSIVLLDFFYIKQYDALTTTEAVTIFGAQLVYAGFHVKQIQKDKQDSSVIEVMKKEVEIKDKKEDNIHEETKDALENEKSNTDNPSV